MTYTFKLARRLAVIHKATLLLPLAAAAACGGSDSLAPATSGSSTSRTILTPQSTTLPVGRSIQFAAYQRLVGGDSVALRNVSWSASGGSIEPTGLFVASAPGVYQVVGRLKVGAGQLSDTATVQVVDTVTPPPAPAPASDPSSAGASAAYPHQPTGFSPVSESDASGLPPSGALRGSWWTADEINRGNLTVVSDGSAPQSPGAVLRTRFPAGMRSGIEPVEWGTTFFGNQKRKLYFSMWVKIAGTDYQNQSTAGTKMGFFGYGQATTSPLNQGYIILATNGTQSPGKSYNLHFIQQNNVDRRLTPNVTQHSMTVGSWHHWEAVLVMNDVGQRNGVFRFWLDGVETMNYTDVTYATPGATNGFYSWKWRPTWGGIGGTRSRDDFMLIDHVYISGS
jgi:hypothetical protein